MPTRQDLTDPEVLTRFSRHFFPGKNNFTAGGTEQHVSTDCFPPLLVLPLDAPLGTGKYKGPVYRGG